MFPNHRSLRQSWKLLLSLAVLALVALAGYFVWQPPLKVRITPTSYHAGEVTSAIATPAVDEVVRIRPKKVLIVACRATKPPKIIQFERELRARLEVELKLMLNDEGCPAAE
ncbi:hypothetical protein [Acidovorax sp. FG27]|uniref:hypothetical protein n=1 Tax=Acidovorax sp. FG27 TaxID=3133652 RepID=UPI0030EAB279